MAYTIGALTLLPGAAAAVKGQLRPGVSLAPTRAAFATRAAARAGVAQDPGGGGGDSGGGTDGDGANKGMSPGMIAAGVAAIAALAYVATR